MSSGSFFTFEGIDGCGKTTQLRLLAAHFEKLGREVVATREPGGTKLAEGLRETLLTAKNVGEIAPPAELLLFGAARAQHVAEIIRPALKRGAVVLSDRFGDSSVAYQGSGLGLDADFIRQMNQFATGDLRPDLTFLLDLEPETAFLRRQSAGEDKIEARGLEFQARVRSGFLEIAACEPKRMVILDANRTPEAIFAEILTQI